MNTHPILARGISLMLALIVVLSWVLLALPVAGQAQAQACTELIVNGGFEGGSGWTFGTSPLQPQLVTSPVHSGNQAVRLGNVGQPNQNSYSSVRQTVSIPAGAVSAELSFWAWTISEAPAGNDWQEALLLSPNVSEQSTPVQILWRVRFNNPSWTRYSFDLRAYAGQTLDVYFNVFNDGTAGRTAMILDDVSLNVCQSGGPTATPTQTGAPPANITFVGNLNPPGSSPQTIPASAAQFVTVQVYAPGVTEPSGQGAGIQCFLYYGQVTAFGGTWTNITTVPMTYNGDVGNNDRYGANLGPVPAGLYEYTAYCQSGAAPAVWSDNNATGGNGKLTVTGGATATPTATTTPPGGPVVGIAWVGNLNPPGSNPQTIAAGAALFVTVQVYAPGVTEPPGQGAGIQCFLYYGQVSAFGGNWSNITTIPMTYNGDTGNNDRYGVNLGPLPAGLYEYTAFCRSGTAQPVWSDNSATGGNGKLTVSGEVTATSTPTQIAPATGTPPPPPADCQSVLRNGGFEAYADWVLGRTERQPAYVTSPVHSGNWAMRLGTEPGVPDVASYSSIRQRVMLPRQAERIYVQFWYYPISEDAASAGDRQELILLDSRTGATLKVLWRVTENDRAWKYLQLDMSAYRGYSLDVYFNALNNGNGKRTALILDDVDVLACGSAPPQQPMPWPPHQPMPWPSQQPPPPSMPQPAPATVMPTIIVVTATWTPVSVSQLTLTPALDVTLTPTLDVTPTPTTTLIIGQTATPTVTQTPRVQPTNTATPRSEGDNGGGSAVSDILSEAGFLPVACVVGLVLLLSLALVVSLFSR